MTSIRSGKFRAACHCWLGQQWISAAARSTAGQAGSGTLEGLNHQSILQSVSVVVLAGLSLALVGCAPEISTTYGRAAGGMTPVSVNGTDALAGMFIEAGHHVARRRVLVTSKLDSVDAIVWFPDDFSAPTEEVCEWFDEWLAARPGRTLIFVGRDYDAAPYYWRAMLPYAPPEQRLTYRKRIRSAREWADAQATRDRKEDECEWFKIKFANVRSVRELAGPWREDVDPVNIEIVLRDRLAPPSDARRLLTSTPDVLVSRLGKPEWTTSQAILVANGSFLLNEPLVNREHRILAGKLVATVGPPGRVIFLESGPGGPPIDPPLGPLGLWRMFGAWPLNAILLHLAALGIIFCFARWPIFGRAKVPPTEMISDFGNHIEAAGQLLRRTRDRDYALTRLNELRGVAIEPRGSTQ